MHAAVACDMETYAIAEVCRVAKVPFLSVRVISDALEDELPKEVERLLEQHSLASKLGAATGAIFNRPSSIKDMWNLKEQAIKASDRLARFLRSTIAPRRCSVR
jgi:adenosylhomocysteine nucleosidase